MAKDLVRELAIKQVILLRGPLGVGKSQLARFIVRELGGAISTSPTFSVHNQYATPKGVVDHVDLYRMESTDDLESTGFWDLFARESGLIIIEWSERLEEKDLPADWSRLTVELEFVGDDERKVQIT